MSLSSPTPVLPPSSISLRRMMTGLSALPSMTPSLKMDCWAATNQSAARCPNWQRNCVNATPPPAQVGLLWLTHWLTSSYMTSNAFHFRVCFLIIAFDPSVFLQRQLFQLQCRLLSAEEKGETEKLVTKIGDIFRRCVIIMFNFVFRWLEL